MATKSREAFIDLGEMPLASIKRPAQGKILVKREPTPTSYGMVILPPKDANDRRFEASSARIIALGNPDVDKLGNIKSWSVKVDDRVLITKFAGHDLTIEGDDSYNLLAEDDIMAVVDCEDMQITA